MVAPGRSSSAPATRSTPIGGLTCDSPCPPKAVSRVHASWSVPSARYRSSGTGWSRKTLRGPRNRLHSSSSMAPRPAEPLCSSRRYFRPWFRSRRLSRAQISVVEAVGDAGPVVEDRSVAHNADGSRARGMGGGWAAEARKISRRGGGGLYESETRSGRERTTRLHTTTAGKSSDRRWWIAAASATLDSSAFGWPIAVRLRLCD